MNKHEKVRIDLSQGRGSDPPLELKKAKNLYPSNNNFKLVPKYLPALEKFVRKVKWNSVEKTLEVKILETPNFESFAWFGTINERFAESQKSSFVDFEQDSIRLYFLDNQGREVAGFKFLNLKLLEHDCPMTKQTCDSFGLQNDHCDHVSHNIVIQYQNYKTLAIQQAEAEAEINTNPQKAIDKEWKSLNTSDV